VILLVDVDWTIGQRRVSLSRIQAHRNRAFSRAIRDRLSLA